MLRVARTEPPGCQGVGQPGEPQNRLTDFSVGMYFACHDSFFLPWSFHYATKRVQRIEDNYYKNKSDAWYNYVHFLFFRLETQALAGVWGTC